MHGHARPRRVRSGRGATARARGNVRVRPGEREADGVRRDAGTMVVSVGGTPGKPYDLEGCELWCLLRKLYEAGEYAEVVARGREAIETSPTYGLLFYNVACCESLTGQTTDAIEHLRRAIELSSSFGSTRSRIRSSAQFVTSQRSRSCSPGDIPKNPRHEHRVYLTPGRGVA